MQAPPHAQVRRVLSWIAIVLGGVISGLAVAFAATWWQSHLLVRSWLADPARTAPGVIWSAPIEVRVGQSATVEELAGDLLAAGYSRLEPFPDRPDGMSPSGVFAIDGDTLKVWTEPMTGPGFGVPEGRAEIVVREGRVREVSGGDPVVLRPTVLATIGDARSRRSAIDVAQLSPWLEPAVLAIEDERFRRHIGVDPFGIARAARENLERGETVEGGSTLTQQLAKNLFLSPDRTFRRKIREAVLALTLEMHLTKDEILELYLGEVYLGQMGGLPLYGVTEASRAWFGKEPRFLELHEAALVAGVIAAPNRYSPVRRPEAARVRRDHVLQRMVELGMVGPSVAALASEQEIEIAGLEPSRVRRAPYAVDYAVDVAERELGAGALATGGHQVWTFIQPQLQRTAEEAVQDGLAEVGRTTRHGRDAQAALVAVGNDDGGIVALVGGRSYLDSPYNRAVDSRRQAGSTIKPLTLLAALDGRVVTLSEVLLDAPITRKAGSRTWTPRNYGGGYVGPVTVRRAVELSRNVPAVLLSERVGLERLQRVWKELGLSGATAWPSAALGAFEVSPLELAGAYTVFPNGGVRHEPLIVRAITTADGEEIRRFASDVRRIADPRPTALAVSVLEGVLRHGTGTRAWSYGVKPPVAGKTGTTDDYRDAWFVGFTPELTVAVWVGRDRGALGLPGGEGALPTWARFVARSGVSGGSFPAPDGLVSATICAVSGQLALPTCPGSYTETFVRGSEPVASCPMHRARPDFDPWQHVFGPDGHIHDLPDLPAGTWPDGWLDPYGQPLGERDLDAIGPLDGAPLGPDPSEAADDDDSIFDPSEPVGEDADPASEEPPPARRRARPSDRPGEQPTDRASEPPRDRRPERPTEGEKPEGRTPTREETPRRRAPDAEEPSPPEEGDDAAPRSDEERIREYLEHRERQPRSEAGVEVPAALHTLTPQNGRLARSRRAAERAGPPPVATWTPRAGRTGEAGHGSVRSSIQSSLLAPTRAPRAPAHAARR